MSTIVTRSGKGSPLTHSEMDSNLTNLNTDKYQSGDPITVSSISDTGNLAFTGAGNRITGDFSNATVANRVIFQTSTVNGATRVGAIPNGTNPSAFYYAWSSTDPTNASEVAFGTDATNAYVIASKNGTGTYLPMTFYTGGAERMRIDTSGNVGVGGAPSSTFARLEVKSASRSNNAGEGSVRYSDATTSGIWSSRIDSSNAFNWDYYNGSAWASLVKIDASGNLLHVNSTGGLGYGTGAGGTVTQATSKSTAVTLNKPTGKITTHNASLAGGASVIFQVLNDKVGANAVVVANVVSATNNYKVDILRASTNDFMVYLTNITGGALTDAVEIQFAVIKGATS